MGMDVPYTLDDYVPITQLTGGTPFVFCARPDFPAADGKALIELLRKNPGKYNYSSLGNGSGSHLSMELVKNMTRTFMLHIPYRGIARAINDLLGVQTQAMFPGLAVGFAHLEIRAI